MDFYLVCIAVIAGIGIIDQVVKRWPRSAQSRFDAGLREFVASRGDEPFQDTQDNLLLLTTATEFRVKLSAAVVADPSRYNDIISEMAREEILKLTCINRDLGKRFMSWVNDATTSDLLLSDAMRSIQKL